jgi:hypothetical protein
MYSNGNSFSFSAGNGASFSGGLDVSAYPEPWIWRLLSPIQPGAV